MSEFARPRKTERRAGISFGELESENDLAGLVNPAADRSLPGGARLLPPAHGAFINDGVIPAAYFSGDAPGSIRGLRGFSAEGLYFAAMAYLILCAGNREPYALQIFAASYPLDDRRALRSDRHLARATVVALTPAAPAWSGYPRVALYATTYLFSTWTDYTLHFQASFSRLLLQVTPVGWLAIALVLPWPKIEARPANH